ncbi:MAG: HypC/HybG/HupF family hydrogenase formation chaperone [Bacteroidetes bacterium]|nr:HypC/HybG/HupF family hydrogenase formation chaperone [Bacteroidota bacterium]
MCLAVPAKVISVEYPFALVSVEDVEYRASIMLLENVQIGEYVMMHAGFAIEKVNQQEAEETLRLLNEVDKHSIK